MAQIDVTLDESQLLAVYRAIVDFNNPQLVGIDEVGTVLDSVKAVIDLEKKHKELSASALKALIYGFIAGYGASKLPQLIYEYNTANDVAYEEDYGASYSGGPTGGVVDGQGEDPRLVKQTGPQPDQE